MARTATSPFPSSRAGVAPDLAAGALELPPTLQPAAIFQAAPPRDRRLSALVTLNVYAGLLLMGWVWLRPGAGTEPLREVPRQTMTLLFEEPSAPAALKLAPSIQGGGAAPAEALRAFASAPAPSVSELILPMSQVSEDLPEPAEARLAPVVSAAGGQAGPGSATGSGRGDGKGFSKGSGRAMFRAVPGLSPGLDLNDLEVLHEEIPSYPLLAEWGRIQGDVVVRVTINEKGVPIRTELQEGPEALQAETMRAVKRWRFGRGIFRGQKVNATFDMTFRYILRERTRGTSRAPSPPPSGSGTR
ncbi:MAG: energy transducer TonB [Geothrix sp.]|nr:energy transducer TonB [Geothrix sp.]